MSDAKVVTLPTPKDPMRKSPGFAKKLLSTWKLDLSGLCGYGCGYCSSNAGNYLRINRTKFADVTEEQLGERLLPADEPALTFEYRDILDALRIQVRPHPHSWGYGETLVFSMLTDGFSPRLVRSGTTEEALRIIMEGTSFRIRILTKNSCVGAPFWRSFFLAWPGRFVVGLSIGTMDDQWAKRIEVGTSSPSARMRALRSLQDAGVPTYGMLCPVFPDVLADRGVERLADAIRPGRCESVWAEPYNDRQNWLRVREGYDEGSRGYEWLTRAYKGGDRRRHRKGAGNRKAVWSSYATTLLLRLRDKAKSEGWGDKLRYLLYEGGIAPADAAQMGALDGVLLQSTPDVYGRSLNPHIRRLQGAPEGPGQMSIFEARR